MKIFSLEAKKHLAGWSVTLGVFINLLVSKFTKNFLVCQEDCSNVYFQGWPIKVRLDAIKVYGDEGFPLVVNLLFWILFILIILSLIRYFRTKY